MARLRDTLILPALFICLTAFPTGHATAQTVFPVSQAPGILIKPDGTLVRRVEDRELDDMRTRARAAQEAKKSESIGYVSLPKAFESARAAVDAGKPIPDDVKYLGGLTRIDFLFVYPETHDLVIAGPMEPVQVFDDTHAFGKRSQRPVVRLDDVAVALRLMGNLRRGGAFGCRLDPDPAAPKRVEEALAAIPRASHAERAKVMQENVGPQKVSFFGGIPDDTRFAQATLAADYELKRYGLGLAKVTVADLGNGVDSSRAAVNMFWFELAYDPIRVSADKDAYGLRGPRLAVKAGGFDWDPKGATPKAFDFAKRMSQRLELLASQQPLISDLQNLGDVAVIAALIHRDRLIDRTGWDASWAMNGFPVMKLPVPKTAEALVNYTNGSLAAGGVVLSPLAIASATEADAKDELTPAKKRYQSVRGDGVTGPIVGGK